MSALSCSIAAGGIWNGDAEQTAGALLRFTFSLKKKGQVCRLTILRARLVPKNFWGKLLPIED